ncbi:MAG TPA: nucleotide exchange factor GrpE [Feifaniaceae bacterium]|nr:nucleotide exchange factor GrpE [Feifaniaceae bacterium]
MARKTANENAPLEETIVNDQAAGQAQAPEGTAQEPRDEEFVKLSKAEFDTVKTHIEALKNEKDEAVALAQRLQADFDNYRKRNATLKADSYQEGMRDCVKALIPSLDNFDLAVQNMETVDPCYLDGVKLVQRTLLDALNKLGLQEIQADGVFDPNLHNAVLQEPAEGRQSGEILEVFQKGFEMNGRILRHSMVKVAE